MKIAAAGAILLTLCDQLFHVRTGTLVYHWHPQIAGQTIIVPLAFFIATLAMLEVSRRVRPRRSTRTVIASMGIVTAAYLLSGSVGPSFAGAYALVLLALWVLRIVQRRDSAVAVAAAVMIAAGGVLGESALIAVGEFSYAHPDLLGVPWWLFPLYLHGALAAFDLANQLEAAGEASVDRHHGAGDEARRR